MGLMERLRSKVILFIIFALFTFSANAKIMAITCKGIDKDTNLEVNDRFDSDNSAFNELEFKIGDQTFSFDKQIGRDPQTLLGAQVIQGNLIFAYYIPNQEINSGNPPFRGRIIMAFKEDGHLIESKSKATDAWCSFN